MIEREKKNKKNLMKWVRSHFSFEWMYFDAVYFLTQRNSMN